jgi:NADH/NAD ratio-sensing transcriptional regulator Rex
MANTYRNSNQKNQSTMRRMVSYLRSLASRRSSGVVTADDAHVFLTRMGVRERQVRTRLSYINSAFASGLFEQAGTTYSTRPAAKGRAISTWATA